jgi:restriction endonuclease S subunit
VSGLAGGKGRAIEELIASHVKNIERLERENETLRQEWLRRERFKLA